MILSQSEARAILERTLSFVTADEAEVMMAAGVEGNIRFARNLPTTTGSSTQVILNVSCVFGARVGRFTTSELDDTALERAVRSAEQIARLSPESPEYMPRLGPQQYLESPEHDEATASVTPTDRVRTASTAIDAARAAGLDAAGFTESGTGFRAHLNSKGQFGYHRSTAASFTLTTRAADGAGSGWAASESHSAGAIDVERIVKRSVDKAVRSMSPDAIEPGTYTVVLEPSAVGDMLNTFARSLGRRSADEGRSFFSDPEHGTKIGQKLFGDDITIYSDPTNPIVPSIPWGEDGLPLDRTIWVERGVQRNLSVARYWARQKGLEPLPAGSNIIMEGADNSIDDLIASTERGLLVTSFWYIREVDPQTILYTGLTRDGLFLIENGEITRPVVNLRWNESPASIFRNVQMMSRPERAVTREASLPTLAPALKVGEFHFTSVSPST